MRKGLKNKLNRCIKFFIITILLSLSANTVYAYDLFPGRFDTGKITYGVIAGGDTAKEYAQTAVKQWNGVSSKVKIQKYTGKDPRDAKLRLNFNAVKAPTKGALGITYLQKGYTVVSVDSTWTHATCVQYKDTEAKKKSQRLKTCVHEIGHSLSLAHPTGGKAASPSIMEQGLRTRYKLYERDKNHLIYKWGK